MDKQLVQMQDGMKQNYAKLGSYRQHRMCKGSYALLSEIQSCIKEG